LAVTACGDNHQEGIDDPDDTPSTSSPISTQTTTTSVTYPRPDAGCTEAQPTALEIAPETIQDKPFVDKFFACTNVWHTRTRLTNNSPLVWELSRKDSQALRQPVFNQARYDLFSEYASQYLGMEGTILFQPDTTIVVDAAPELLTWTPTVLPTAAWQVHDKAFKVLEEKVLAKTLASAFARDPARKAAYHKCITLGISVAKLADAAGEQVATQHLMSGLSFARNGPECAAALQSVDDTRVVTSSGVLDDAARSFTEPVALSTLDDNLKFAKANLLRRGVLRLLRRGG
jgi:hypothetical protein